MTFIETSNNVGSFEKNIYFHKVVPTYCNVSMFKKQSKYNHLERKISKICHMWTSISSILFEVLRLIDRFIDGTICNPHVKQIQKNALKVQFIYYRYFYLLKICVITIFNANFLQNLWKHKKRFLRLRF